MPRPLAALLCLVALTGAGCVSTDPSPTTAPTAAVIPQPLDLAARSGVLVLRDGDRISVPPGDASAHRQAERFADLMARTRRLRLSVTEEASGKIRLERGAPGRPDSYRLDVGSDQAVVSAGDDAGLQYGLTTLWQLTTQTTDGPAPIAAMTITDAPRFAWRGVMLDSARHYQSPEFIKGFIDWMALHKLNVFHWHLTDDQAWRLEIRRYPKLTDVGAWRVPEGAAARADIDPATGRPRLYGGFYTQAEVREIVAYAAERNITVVPEIDVPGHASAAIAAYPELGVRDAPGSAVEAVPSDWGVYHTLFNTDDATIAFFETVLGEVVELFPGPYVHLGGDEAVKDQWKASPSTQARIRQLGLADENALQNWMMGRLEAYLTGHGRKLIGWDEILEGPLAGDATIMSWRGISGAIEAARAGHDTVLTPAPIFYLDNRQSSNDGSPGRAHVVSMRELYEFDPTPPELTADQIDHVLGVQGNLWTEHMVDEDRVEHQAYPRIAALAELAWSAPERTDWADFSLRLRPQLARYRALGVDYAESALDTGVAALPPQGERRYDHQMRLCSNAIALSLIDDAPVRGDRAAFMMDIMNPCWIYQDADLSGPLMFEAAVGQVPFNFQIGADLERVVVRRPSTPEGELQVRLDGCEGPIALEIPLRGAARSDGVTVIEGRLPAATGRHDLCLTFTQNGRDPMWGVDWVRLIGAEGR